MLKISRGTGIILIIISALASTCTPAYAKEESNPAVSSSVALQGVLQAPPILGPPSADNPLPVAIQAVIEIEEDFPLEEEDFLYTANQSNGHSDTEPVAMVDTPLPIPKKMVLEEETKEAEEEVVLVEEPSIFAKLWSYLGASKEATIQRGRTYLMKRQMESKYGAVSPIDINTLLEQEKALEAAEDVRYQRELAIRVKADEYKQLYTVSLMCLALNGYYEARGETADQEVATAAVVLNRLSVGFRSAITICEVIQTPAQFSWVVTHGLSVPRTTNRRERRAWERSLLIAKRMLDPDATYIDPSNSAIYYYNPSIVDWKYKLAYDQVAILGNHRFMAERDPNHKYYIDNYDIRINPVLFNGLTHDQREQLKKEFQYDSYKVGL